jgi:CRP-like cAMP-binding protein
MVKGDEQGTGEPFLAQKSFRFSPVRWARFKGEEMDFRETTHSTYQIDEAFAPAFSRSVRPVERKQSPASRLRPVLPAAVERENLILSSLSPQLKQLLATLLKPVVLSKEEFLYQEGDALEYVYFPMTAVVSEFKILEDGRMVEIAVTGREGAIGLASLFSDMHVAPNCTQVSQAGTAMRLDSDTFEKLMKSNDELRMSVSHFVDLYIRQISQKAICNMYHSVKERLCTWLLMVHDRCGRSTLNLTHEQIARTLGVYRPSITCIAQELRSKKLINYSRGGISISDREKVEQAACTCYFETGCAVPNL